jgi:hypothetical protein
MSAIVAPRMHADAYHSLAFARIEDETIWTREWLCIGVDEDIAGAGDLLPFTAGDHAVHVQRLASGRLAGRFNLAQHGGCRVVPLQCRQGAKTSCSFTSCGHSRDRPPLLADAASQPSAQMHQYLGLRPERLLGVRTAVAGALLFVHLDPAGSAFQATSAPTFSHHAPSRQGHAWLEIEGNWKHVGQRIAAGKIAPGDTDRCASFHRVDSTVNASWFFPNLIVLTHAGSTCVVVLQPIALQRTVCRLSVYGADSLPLWRDRLLHACIPPYSQADESDSRRWFETLLEARIAQRMDLTFNGDDI